MPRTYIHIGTHKTGSTAIQSTMAANRKWLLGRGYVYLPFPSKYWDMCDEAEMPRDLVLDAREWYRQVSKWHSKRSIIISQESLSGNPWKAYRNAPALARALRNIVKGTSPKVVVYLRRQDSFLESLYTEHVQEGATVDFAQFLRAYGDPPDYLALTGVFEREFGRENLDVRIYSKARFTGGKILTDFFTTVGLGEVPPTKASWVNKSMSNEALEYMREKNAVLEEAERLRTRIILQELLPKGTFMPFNFFSDTERTSWLAKCEAGNAKLSERYFDGAPLFEPVKSEGETWRFGSLDDKRRKEIDEMVRQALSRGMGRSEGVSYSHRIFNRISRIPERRRKAINLGLRIMESMGWR